MKPSGYSSLRSTEAADDDVGVNEPMISDGNHEGSEELDDWLKNTKRRAKWRCFALFITITFSVIFFVAIILWFRQIDHANYFGASSNPPGELMSCSYTNITVAELLDTLEFPNSTNHLGKNITDPEVVEKPEMNMRRWTKDNKLKIFVLLFSHNDAGWGKTFSEYYSGKTRDILDNVLLYLSSNPQLKFIWTEISFFDKWWHGLNMVDRERVKRLVERKQLEFTGDGWVMPDEATTHYLSYLTQLFEGHQWLKQRFNYSPRSGWAIDPFGLSSSLAFLLQRSGVENKVLARIHYIIKRHLRQEQNLEFNWRQQWDSDGSTDIFTHVMAYASYDKGVTCGPDGKRICNSFSRPHSNLTEVSMRFLQQYRYKSMAFNTNNLLLPLGGDFDWNQAEEWTGLLSNFQDVMKYINSVEEHMTEIKFATLNEYFDAVHEEAAERHLQPVTLSGDFFAYSDAARDYWTGYFTSRAFHKATERQLMSLLRTAQIAYTLTTGHISKITGSIDFKFLKNLLDVIVASRRNLSLFQHHDGISGTSSNYVVRDYADMLHKAIKDCQFVIQQCLFYLNNHERLRAEHLERLKLYEEYFKPSLHKGTKNDIWQHKVYTVDSENPIEVLTVFNPLEYGRTEVVRIFVSQPYLTVFRSDGSEIPSEIYPAFQNFRRMQYNDFVTTPKNFLIGNHSDLKKYDDMVYANDFVFELNFVVDFKPFEVGNFKLFYQENIKRVFPKIRVFNGAVSYVGTEKAVFDWYNSIRKNETLQDGAVEIFNHQLTLKLGKNGLPETVKLCGLPYKFNLGFYEYKAKYMSGLYSFNPYGAAEPSNVTDPVVIVVEGAMKSYVEVWLPYLRHRISLYNHTGLDSNGIHIDNIVDMRNARNIELSMRISNGINSINKFYTDSNGYQMIERKFRKNLPLQGNFYPVASSAFIEDQAMRMTILAGQPAAGTSLDHGQLELMQDRTEMYDDGHGIGQGYQDNLPTMLKYKIILEPFEDPKSQAYENTVPVLSLTAHHLLHSLIHPVQTFSSTYAEVTALSGFNEDLFKGYSADSALPCDIQLTTTLPFSPVEHLPKGKVANDEMSANGIQKHVGLLLHRVAYDGRLSNVTLESICNFRGVSKLRVADLFGGIFEPEMRRMTVSFLHHFSNNYDWSADAETQLESMEVYGLKARYARS